MDQFYCNLKGGSWSIVSILAERYFAFLVCVCFLYAGGEELMAPVGVKLQCPPIPPSVNIPTSVKNLRPSDIRVIGAMGNSVTAGAMVRTVNASDRRQYRDYVGLSWSCGGDYGNASKAGTLGNILHFYNNDLKGASLGDCDLFAVGVSCPTDGFNAAVSGSQARDVLKQAKHLVQEMSSDSTVNITRDWKVVTLWIGGNDLCNYCLNDSSGGSTPQSYYEGVKESLDYLAANLPRTFVNLVIAGDITRSEPFIAITNIATCTKSFRMNFCPCYDADVSGRIEEMKTLAENFQKKLRLLTDSGIYERDDFAVVLQPFFENFTQSLPANETLDSYIAVDCFHFGVRGQAALAASLWNNMFEPEEKKAKDVSWDLVAKCPESPYYFATNDFSGSSSTHVSKGWSRWTTVTVLAIIALNVLK
eukprot:m.83286 g.83286  ORF g.83286 m.83286 type:complete len:419 (+) comp36336_c0_seq5:25-1281(+)